MPGRFGKIMVACAALLTATGIELLAAELLQNGDFGSGTLAPWASAQLGGNNPALQVLDGEDGGKVAVLKGAPDNPYNGFLAVVQAIPTLDPQKTYVLTGKFKAAVADPVGKQVRFAIRQETAEKKTLNYLGQDLDLSKKEWQTLEVVVNPDPAGVKFQAYVIGSKLAAEDSVTFTGLSLQPVEIEEGELVINGGFETGRLTPWRSAQRSGGQKDLHTLSANTRNGKFCLQVTGDPENQFNNFISLVQRLPQLDPQKTYLLSCRVRCEIKEIQGKSAELSIRQAKDEKTGIGYFGVCKINLADDSWKHYEVRFRPNPAAKVFDLYVLARQLGANDAVFVDEISLREDVDAAKPFDPAAKEVKTGTAMTKGGVAAKIDDATGLLRSLSLDGEELQPEAANGSVVFVQKGMKEFALDGKGTPSAEVPFAAKAEYQLGEDGIFTEIVTITATADAEGPFKVGVRHGFDPAKFSRIINALRPVRAIPAGSATIFSYGGSVNDRNLGDLDTYQHVAFPMSVLESKDSFILAGDLSLDDFITFAPNHPANSFPSLQRNPLSVKKGDAFRFVTSYKRFPKSGYMLRDVWRFYCDHLTTNDPALAKFIPPRITKERTFFRGPFCGSTFFLKEREDNLPENANIWFYSWHDNIRERYPVEGEWWSDGNMWAKKQNAEDLKKYVSYLQNDLHHRCIFYLRQLANLKLRGTEFPESWYKREAGGALHLYGGGYTVKLPPHVAKDVGYDKLPWGSFDFANPEYRDFYSKEIFKAINFYQPKAIGWDMGSDIYEFLAIADTYMKLQERGGQVKAVANESAGPTQPYADMVIVENGILGGKSPDDFEVLRAYTTAVVCIERGIIFREAVILNLDGGQSWLSAAGLAENKYYLVDLMKRHPELDRNQLAQYCQIRVSLYDLSLGASPGYLEEAKLVRPTLKRFTADVNGLYAVNKSFAVQLENGLNIDGRMAASAWQDAKALRVVAFNNSTEAKPLRLRLDRAHFASLGWSADDWQKAKAAAVSPEGEKELSVNLSADEKFLIVTADLEPFTLMALEINR